MPKNKANSNKNIDKDKGGDGVAIGAGIVTVGAALAAGYYFYMSKDAKKHRKIAAEWASDLKNDILEKAQNLKENLNQETLVQIMDEVAKTYYTAKNVSKEEVLQAVEELKQNWTSVLEELNKNKSETKPKKLSGKK